MITNEEKLALIELLIEQTRNSPPNQFGWRSHETHLVLKAIANDIRARPKASNTIEIFERALRNAKDRQTYLGYEMGNLREIAELTIGRWSTIKQALEKFE